MPLYELVLIMKCTHPMVTANVLRNITKYICSEGGNVREANILADRLLTKQLKSIDGQFTLVGRYTQLLVDGSPMVMDAITRELKKDKMVLSTTHFNVKDFYSYAEEYKKPVMSQIDTTSRKREVAKKIAILKENGG